MEAYLQGQDLQDIVPEIYIEIPTNTSKNADAKNKWSIKCGKALYVPGGLIQRDMIDHIHNTELLEEVQETIEKLFTRMVTR